MFRGAHPLGRPRARIARIAALLGAAAIVLTSGAPGAPAPTALAAPVSGDLNPVRASSALRAAKTSGPTFAIAAFDSAAASRTSSTRHAMGGRVRT